MSELRLEARVIRQCYPASGKSANSRHNTCRCRDGVIARLANFVQRWRVLATLDRDLLSGSCGIAGLGVRQTLR